MPPGNCIYMKMPVVWGKENIQYEYEEYIFLPPRRKHHKWLGVFIHIIGGYKEIFECFK